MSDMKWCFCGKAAVLFALFCLVVLFSPNKIYAASGMETSSSDVISSEAVIETETEILPEEKLIPEEAESAPSEEIISDTAPAPADGSAQQTAPDSVIPAETEDEAKVLGVSVEDGWNTIEGATFYFKNGEPLKGYQRIDGSLFYFENDSGRLISDEGFTDIDDSRVYSESGRLLTGVNHVDGKILYFDENGGFTEKDGTLSLSDNNRGTDNEYYLVDGEAFVGVMEINGDKILFDNMGRRVTEDGWKTVLDPTTGAAADYFVYEGKVADGFIECADGMRYFKSGVAIDKTGWEKINGSDYYFENGIVRTGMQYVDNSCYFLSPDDNGEKQTGWLELYGSKYYADSSGVIQRDKLFDAGGLSYIADQNGALRYGWITLGKDEYYAWSSGALAKNTTVDGVKLDSNGRKVIIPEDSEVIRLAKKLIEAAAPSSASNAEKLRLSFNYIVKNCTYKRDYTDPLTLSGDWREKYAIEMFKTHLGNCYRYASAFAYVAEALGYDARVTVGKVSAVGGGLTPHAVTEVIVNGKTYVCDANLQKSRPSYDWYMMTYSSYHYTFKKGKTFDVTK